jgi:DNA-binding SARP family transcriptional activator
MPSRAAVPRAGHGTFASSHARCNWRADVVVDDRIGRTRFAAWLADTAGSAVRIVCAPLGSGKTCALQHYADGRGGRTGYVRVPAATNLSTIREILDRADEFDEIVLDEIDRAAPDACRSLVDEIADGMGSKRLILAGRSRRHLMGHALIARGLATACDPALLRFDVEEISRLATRMGVAHDRRDVEQLLYDTDGWAIAAQWIVRDAVESGRSLRDAFVPWRERNAHLFQEFIEDELAKDGGSVPAFRGLLRDDVRGEEAEELEQRGFPIVRTRSGLRPFRILARLGPAVDTEIPPATVPPMMVNAFGRFRCEIGGRPVSFLRRRDQHVFTYVAVSRGCRSSRSELLEAFWPGVNRSVASQGLRTTLSRIRRAISAVAPFVDPGQYFQTVGEVRIDTRTVSVDVHRFLDHADAGRSDESRNQFDAAKQHYRIAQRIYADRLLASEAREPCFERLADGFETLYVWMLRRVVELHSASGELDKAHEAASALRSCNSDEARNSAMNSIAGIGALSA